MPRIRALKRPWRVGRDIACSLHTWVTPDPHETLGIPVTAARVHWAIAWTASDMTVSCSSSWKDPSPAAFNFKTSWLMPRIFQRCETLSSKNTLGRHEMPWENASIRGDVSGLWNKIARWALQSVYSGKWPAHETGITKFYPSSSKKDMWQGRAL